MVTTTQVIPFTELGMDSVPTVGGKNASLGEMISRLNPAGISVPEGFATTADAYRAFLNHDGLGKRIDQELAHLDVEDIAQLTETGGRIRNWIIETPLPQILTQGISQHYAQLGPDTAVRFFVQ